MHMKTSPRTKPVRFSAEKWDGQFGNRGRKQPKRKWEAAKKRRLQSREEAIVLGLCSELKIFQQAA